MARDDFTGTHLSVSGPRCYESHPKLKLGKGVLYGGSASHPITKKADVYVSLQKGSWSGLYTDPWDDHPIVEISYSIDDMKAPPNTQRFKNMIDWLCNQLQSGKKVHVGCIGGHGRTGMVLAAIVAQLLEEKDAIQWVREHYCKKVVESHDQVNWLHHHYGISKVEPTKVHMVSSSTGAGFTTKIGKSLYALGDIVKFKSSKEDLKVKRLKPDGWTENCKKFEPLPSVKSIWKTQ